MEQILEKAREYPTHFIYQDVKNPEEFEFRYQALGFSIAKNFQECIDCCIQGLDINPQSSYLFYMRGRTFSDTEHFQEGINDLMKAIRQRKDFAEAWFELGRIHQMVGDMDEAITDYYAAHHFEPTIKIYEENSNGSGEDPHGSFPTSTKTLDENGVKIVLKHIRNTPKEIDVTITGYFAVCGEKKLLPEYIVPPNNIRLLMYSKSDELVREWCKQLGQLLLDGGIDVQLRDNGNSIHIETQNAETKEWLPAVIMSGHEPE